MPDLTTPLDELLDFIVENKKVSIRDAAKKISQPEGIVEDWAHQLKELIQVNYSLIPIIQPKLTIKNIEKASPKPPPQPPEGNVLDTYTIEVDHVPAQVTIVQPLGEGLNMYFLQTLELGPATKMFLELLVDKLTDAVPVKLEDIADPKRMAELKHTFFLESQKLIHKTLRVSPEKNIILSGILLHKTFGLGDIELLMGDDNLEEICVNTAHLPLTVYHMKYGWLQTNLYLPSEKSIYDYASQIGRKSGRNISNLNPVMDTRLITGDRVNATLFPVSTHGNTITIRKFARNPWTIVDFIEPERNTLSAEIAAFLWLCVQYELNVLVAGGTASGKTSLLNCITALIPPTQRVISIEDTREIRLPKYLDWNWVPLTTRNPNPEGLGGVDMLDLIVTSLRMRPDRIIVGEIRRKEEAEVLFEAMHTGHSVYSTMHADTSRHVQRRLTEKPMEIPEAQLESLQLIVTQYRDRRKGIRRTFEVVEVIPGAMGGGMELNYLYRWRAKNDIFEAVNDSKRVYFDLNLHTGMTSREIEEELENKKKILLWMLKEKINTVDGVGKVMQFYYRDPDDFIHLLEKGDEALIRELKTVEQPSSPTPQLPEFSFDEEEKAPKGPISALLYKLRRRRK